MTATHGLNTALFLGGYEISQFFRSTSIDANKDTVETTTFKASSKSYIGGLRDGTGSADGIFDGEETGGDEILRAAFDAAADIFTYWPEGDVLGKFGFGMSGIQTAHAITSSIDDVVQCSMEIQSKHGVDRVRCLHVGEEETADDGTTVDGGAATSAGAVGYIQATDVQDELDVEIEHSTDGDVWTTLLTFSTLTDIGAERVQVSGTVNRYVRVTFDPGTDPATFIVGLSRHTPSL